MRTLAYGLMLAALGCASVRPMETRPPVARLFSGEVGWFRVTPLLQLDAEDRPVLPALTPELLTEDPPVKRLLMRTYAQQFAAVPADQLCAPGGRDSPGGPVFVLVHGVGGDGVEWVPVVPTLARSNPRAMYLYRWFFPWQRGELLDPLISGMERIAKCHPGARIVLLAHSAGGVLASFAASRFEVPPGTSLEVLTVASPLAGAGMRQDFDVEDDEVRFLLQLGGAIRAYAPPARGVTVVHLRTEWPADHAMKPSAAGYRPNDPRVAVPGARVVDLPSSVDHATSLLFVARELVEQRL